MFISLLSMIICLLYKIVLDDQHLTIYGLKTIIIDLAQIEEIDKRRVNGFSHINFYLKG